LQAAGISPSSLHLTGHSMGAVLEAKAAAMLHQTTGEEVATMALLDAPFWLTADSSIAEDVVKAESLTNCVGSPNIPGIVNTSQFGLNHGAMIDVYIGRIENNESLVSDTPPGQYGPPAGFLETVWSAVNWAGNPFGFAVEVGAELVLHEGSPAAYSTPVTFDDAAMFLSFDVRFVYPGDGDFLAVLFNDELLFVMADDTGAGSTTPLSSGAIDISPFAGQIGTLDFVLYSTGSMNSEVRISNLQIGSAVPEPATLALLALGGLGVLVRVARRRRP